MNPTEMTEAYNEMINQCDGPVTKFVIIARAINLAYNRTFGEEEISNALSEAIDYIEENGDLSTNEFDRANAL